MGRTTAVAAGAAGIAAMALLSGVISPWYKVANHPVRLTLQNSVDAVDLCWKIGGCEHFVRKPDTPDVWLAELPPERHYDVRLHFPNGIRTAAKARLTILDTDKISDSHSNQTIVPLMEQVVDIPELAPGGTDCHCGSLDRGGADDSGLAGVVVIQLGAIQVFRRVELHADHSIYRTDGYRNVRSTIAGPG
jgi:hypothetical protein